MWHGDLSLHTLLAACIGALVRGFTLPIGRLIATEARTVWGHRRLEGKRAG